MKTVFNLILLPTALFCSVESVRGQGAQPWLERETHLMGTILRAQVQGERTHAIEALEAAFSEVRRLEGILSSWTDQSEIGRVNAAPVGTPVTVTPELTALLAEATLWTGRTGGAFDPGVGALVDAWDLRGAGRRPTCAERNEALRSSGMDRFHLDFARSSVSRTAPDAWIDTGGFGKGAALRAAERVLRANGIGAAFLDFGGQALTYGEAPPSVGEWKIAVAHPLRRQVVAATLRLRSGSAATTGQSERYVEVAGGRYGHVLDPRTGMPAPALGSVTVVAPDPLVADILSTALFVMGPEAGRRWAQGRAEGILFLELDESGIVATWNEAFEQYRTDNQLTMGLQGR